MKQLHPALMKRARKAAKSGKDDMPDALAAYGERFMSMFDDYDEHAAKKAKHAAPVAAAGDRRRQQGASSNEDDSESGPSGSSSSEEAGSTSSGEQQQPGSAVAAASTADSKLEAFLSGRKGNRRSRGVEAAAAAAAAAAAPKPSKQQIAAQQRQQEQQRLLERKLKKQFMSSKVDKIFSGVDPQQLAAAAAAAEEEAGELTPEQFAAIKRDVQQLGASALDKRSAKAYTAAMLSKLGASADKRPRIPAKMGLGMAKKAKQREAVALQEAIAAGMVKAKGRGKKQRALKAKQRDRGLMEAGPGFKNGVLRLPKSALQ